MSNEHDSGIRLDLPDPAPTTGPELFPVMALLLALVLDLDRLTATEGTSS